MLSAHNEIVRKPQEAPAGRRKERKGRSHAGCSSNRGEKNPMSPVLSRFLLISKLQQQDMCPSNIVT
jgi:hypothetical protein